LPCVTGFGSSATPGTRTSAGRLHWNITSAREPRFAWKCLYCLTRGLSEWLGREPAERDGFKTRCYYF
jgi:hypothetical protein